MCQKCYELFKKSGKESEKSNRGEESCLKTSRTQGSTDNFLKGNASKTLQPERKGTKDLELCWTAEEKQGRW